MNKVFTRDYAIASGTLTVKIFYWDTSIHNYFNPESIGEVVLSSGYEDQDELTFYPNVLSLEFLDYEKKNYGILKESFNQTPVHGIDYYAYSNKHSLSLYLNGSLIFQGYIDKATLDYDDDTRRMKFEVVDYTATLKNMSVPHPGPGDFAGGVDDIWYNFKQVYPGLLYNVTNDLDTFLAPSFNGIYLRHNWEFSGDGNIGNPNFTRSLDMNYDSDGYNKIHWFRKYLFEASETFAEYIRRNAFELGAIIGVESYNKIFIVKRFGGYAFAAPRSLSNITYKKYSHLKNVIGVRTKLKRTNWFWHHGEIHTVDGTPGGAFDDSDLYLDIEVIQGRCTGGEGEGDNGPGSYRIISKDGQYANSVLNGVLDPELNIGFNTPQKILGDWTLRSRRYMKDRFECQCPGVNYYMSAFYTIPEEPGVVLRPLEISKSLVKDKTDMTLLEVTTV